MIAAESDDAVRGPATGRMRDRAVSAPSTTAISRIKTITLARCARRASMRVLFGWREPAISTPGLVKFTAKVFRCDHSVVK